MHDRARRGLAGLGEWETESAWFVAGPEPLSDNAFPAASPPSRFTDASTWFPQATSVAIAAPVPDHTSFFKAYLEPAADLVKNVGVAYMGYQTQQDLNAINLERARKGMAPLSPAYAQAMAPQVGVNVGLSAASKQLLLYGAIGLGAMFAISQFTKHRAKA